MDIPKINLDELEKKKKRNFKQRLDFLDMYADWLKKTPNKEWSSQQKKMFD